MKLFLLLLFVVLIYLALFIIHLIHKKKYNGDNLYLHSSFDNNNVFLETIHFVLEKAVFLRVDAYKNYPRGNFLFLRSCIQVTLIYTIIISIVSYGQNFLPDNLKPSNGSTTLGAMFTFAGSYFALIFTFYWNEKNKYKDKWVYLANLYNEIIKNYKSEIHNELMSNSLAIDTVVLMMWNHRSFKYIVMNELEIAINNINDDKKKYHFIEKLENKKLTENEVIKLLEDYQLNLIEKRNEELKTINRKNDG